MYVTLKVFFFLYFGVTQNICESYSFGTISLRISQIAFLRAALEQFQM